jgi:winged helix DNA-binding protein
VDRMIGLHAQVMSSAELQTAARIDGLRPADVRDALWQRRSLVKVWAFRQTLHLLTANDLAEFVVAARSLERWHSPAWLRYFALTEAGVEEMIEAIGAVLSDRPMTRADLVDAVTKRVGKPALREAMLTGWGTFLAPAAQRGNLVFGPSDGRSVAFVQPSAWLGRSIAPADDPAAADDALGRLIVRYLAAFPGASREMIARWWGGGRMAGISRALARLGVPLEEVDIEGVRGLVRREDVEALAAVSPRHDVRLLPGFDPFTNELPRRIDAVLADANHDRVHRTAGWVSPVVLIDGRVAGTWEVAAGKGGAGTVVVQAFHKWRGSARRELESEVDRVAAYLDRRLTIQVGS